MINAGGLINLDAVKLGLIWGMLTKGFQATGVTSWLWNYGNRVLGNAKFNNCSQNSSFGDLIWAPSVGYRPVKFDGSPGNGMDIINTQMSLAAGVEFSDNAAHGIECNRSLLQMSGVVIGSGNAGAGCYAHGTSTVQIADGSTPTLTGTVGDVAVSDPAVEDITWAEVDAGDRLASAAQHTTVEEV
jgi:hypothetical protein